MLDVHASSWDLLGCTMHIPSNLEISLGPRDVPRASPSGQPNTSLLSAVYGYNLPLEDGMAEFCNINFFFLSSNGFLSNVLWVIMQALLPELQGLVEIGLEEVCQTKRKDDHPDRL